MAKCVDLAFSWPSDQQSCFGAAAIDDQYFAPQLNRNKQLVNL